MKSGWTQLWLVVAACAVCTIVPLGGSAQVRTQTTTATGTATQEVKVDRAEVVYVLGNDLVLRMEDGTIRHIANVPDSFRASVNGKEIGIHDLKIGMTLERTTTITTTPKVVTTVQTIRGRVWHVNPPASVILTLEDGSNQRFEIPKGQKFKVEGQMVDAWGLKPGMNVTATKIVEFTVREVQQQKKLTGSMPPAPPAPPADAPILVAAVATPPVAVSPSAPAEVSAPAELPKTGSLFSLFGLLGLLGVASSFGLIAFRGILTGTDNNHR